MKVVYVAECGVYAERYVEGVYLTLEAAKEATGRGRVRWRERDGWTWENGLDGDLAVSIFEYEVRT